MKRSFGMLIGIICILIVGFSVTRMTEEFLLGILHKKISQMLLKEFGLKPSDVINESVKKKLELLILKDLEIFTPV